MRTQRNWMRLALTHGIVALVSPLLGVLLFLLFSFNFRDSLHFGGLLALGFGVFFAYLLFGLLTVLAVLAASPVLLAISKVRSVFLALLIAALTGGLAGWLFSTLFVAPGETDPYGLAAKLAGCLTGIAGAIVLELSWLAKPEADNYGPQAAKAGTNPVN